MEPYAISQPQAFFSNWSIRRVWDTNCTRTSWNALPRFLRSPGSRNRNYSTSIFPGGTARNIFEIMATAKFDDILMGILQHCEQVEPFLDAIFSFLARRTDFFQVMHDRSDKMGFPPGVAEKIVLKVSFEMMVLLTVQS